MKSVFTSREIAHIWAHQNYLHGRSPSAMSFQGRVFRSYATDIGYILQPGHAVLVNSTSYSPTTSTHQSAMRCAVDHFPVRFFVDGLCRGEGLRQMAQEPRRLHEYYLRRAKELLTASKAPRIRQATREGKLSAARHALEHANAVNEFFKLRKAPVNPDDIPSAVARIVRADAKRDREEAKRQSEAAERYRLQQAERLATACEQLTLWRASEGDAVRSAYGFERELFPATADGFQSNAALRLNADKTRVETSQGSQVLVRTVRFLWEFCCMAKETACAIPDETIARFPVLDHYRCNSIDAHGNVIAGCHRIAFAEIENIARGLALPPFNGQAMQAPAIPETKEVQP